MELAHKGIGTVKLGPKCFPDFVQATSFNKRVVMDHVRRLNELPDVSRGQANFEVALRYAYETFKKVQMTSNLCMCAPVYSLL